MRISNKVKVVKYIGLSSNDLLKTNAFITDISLALKLIELFKTL